MTKLGPATGRRVTIFPELSPASARIFAGSSHRPGAIELAVHDLRRYTDDVHRTVDDTPYGGDRAWSCRPNRGAARSTTSRHQRPCRSLGSIAADAVGQPFSQAPGYRARPRVLSCCSRAGRYEGIDARVSRSTRPRACSAFDEVSIGD